MRIQEELEGVRDVLSKLRKREKDIPIIVEGPKDEKALRQLGIEGCIIKIKQNSSIFHVIESLRGRYRKVIVLTDWDRTGGRLAYRIKKACEANEIVCDEDLRKELIKHLKKEIKDVESIPAFLERAEIIVRDTRKGRS